MGFHPTNLAFRFVLEVVGLIGLVRLGLQAASGPWGWALGLSATLVAMTLWANFRVPGDRSAREDSPYAVSGPVRLLIEVAVLGAGVAGWFLGGPAWIAWSYLGALVAHHVLSYDRIGWLLRAGSDGTSGS